MHIERGDFGERVLAHLTSMAATTPGASQSHIQHTCHNARTIRGMARPGGPGPCAERRSLGGRTTGRHSVCSGTGAFECAGR